MPLLRFLRNTLLWAIPATLLWLAITPTYNRFLARAAENAVQLTESPNHTTLKRYDQHNFLIYRDDLQGQTSTGHVSSVRVTSYHFMLIFTAAIFLGVPDTPLWRRLETLGWAALISAFFHIGALLFRIKFIYATQLGSWSAEHYGSFGQNFWGLGRHLLDLPFRFALPLLLWSAFYLDRLLPDAVASEAAGASPRSKGASPRAKQRLAKDSANSPRD
jgi:hypothetical protein